MGRAHAIAFTNVGCVFDLPRPPALAVLADATPELAAAAARDFGFARATGDWRELVADEAVDLVAIAAPNRLHREIALAAIDAGKHVYCEKPLAPSAREAEEMAAAAARAGVRTRVGFQYLCNPMVDLAKEMIDAGEIGEVRTFRGLHAEDYLADAETPWSWRHDPGGGGGAMADLGSHVFAMGAAPAWPDRAGVRRSPYGDRAAPGRRRAASGPWRWRTSGGRCSASPAARRAPPRATGWQPGARCSWSSKSPAPAAPSTSPRSG